MTAIAEKHAVAKAKLAFATHWMKHEQEKQRAEAENLARRIAMLEHEVEPRCQCVDGLVRMEMKGKGRKRE